MPQKLLSPDEFLTRLGQCFTDPSTSSSVWLTHKRLNYTDGAADGDVPMGEEDAEAEHEVLIRATQGDKKFSARIPASSLHTFHTHYGALIKSSFAPLMRKRDKKKEKARADALAKKRKELYTEVAIGSEGKRGKGRRQRARKVAAQKRKEVERERVESRQTEQKTDA